MTTFMKNSCVAAVVVLFVVAQIFASDYALGASAIEYGTTSPPPPPPPPPPKAKKNPAANTANQDKDFKASNKTKK
jgi:hypothetical protein